MNNVDIRPACGLELERLIELSKSSDQTGHVKWSRVRVEVASLFEDRTDLPFSCS